MDFIKSHFGKMQLWVASFLCDFLQSPYFSSFVCNFEFANISMTQIFHKYISYAKADTKSFMLRFIYISSENAYRFTMQWKMTLPYESWDVIGKSQEILQN